jgi:hypothetical protein
MTAYLVEPGDYVQAGQKLARPSTLGFCSSGPHDHFWVQGPDGETTRDVTLSGVPATEIGTNEYISESGNDPPASATPTPLPSPAASPPPAPTSTPAPTASPTPGALLRGDANCDGLVNALDATTVLWMLLGYENWDCAGTTADTNCDGLVDTNDALGILLSMRGLAAFSAETCATPPPPVSETPAATPQTSEPPSPTATPAAES